MRYLDIVFAKDSFWYIYIRIYFLLNYALWLRYKRKLQKQDCLNFPNFDGTTSPYPPSISCVLTVWNQGYIIIKIKVTSFLYVHTKTSLLLMSWYEHITVICKYSMLLEASVKIGCFVLNVMYITFLLSEWLQYIMYK